MSFGEVSVDVSVNFDLLVALQMDSKVRAELHDTSPEIAEPMLAILQADTPVLTGALVSGEDVEYESDPTSDLLFTLYADEQTQLDEWGRVYDLYVEGGALGLATYTNAPNEMFQSTEEDSLDLISGWAAASVADLFNRGNVTARSFIP